MVSTPQKPPHSGQFGNSPWTGIDSALRATNDAGTPPPVSDVPDIFTALQEQLGLRLEKGTGPVEYLVIDHVEKPLAN